MRRIELTMDASAVRLDAWLVTQIDQLSRSALRQLIDQGQVTVDGVVRKASFKAPEGASLVVNLPPARPMTAKAEAIELDVAYEDDWLLVINKPQGMVVHPAPGHQSGTLVNALLYYCRGQLSDLNGVLRPGIVHRIDKDTSGLILVVKNNLVHENLAAQIRRHDVERIYHALAWGQLQAESGTIDAPVGRDPRQRQRMAVVPDGRPAVTHFQRLSQGAKAALLRVKLETGRTHQIRVHLKSIGHPLVGDPLYAPGRPDLGLSGQALHASRLTFEHPVTEQTVTVHSDLPGWFCAAAERLGIAAAGVE